MYGITTELSMTVCLKNRIYLAYQVRSSKLLKTILQLENIFWALQALQLNNLYLLTGYEGNSNLLFPDSNLLFPEYLVNKCFYYTERALRCKMMAEGKIIDVAVKKTITGYNNNINHK